MSLYVGDHLVCRLQTRWYYSRHQPAATWVNTTRYRKYSQVLLMMGKNTAQNM